MTTLAAVGVGLLCFTVTELLHYLLVPEIGRQKERWLAEAISAVVVGVLVARLVAVMHRQHQATLARVQVISEINHHIRNALMAISASAHISQNQQCIRVISEGVNRIEWALREILPRRQPLPEEARSKLMFYGVSRNVFSNTPRSDDTQDMNLALENVNERTENSVRREPA
jgi:succinate dehydrogenase hydrophobic anchor subunit